MKVELHVQHNTGASYEDRCEMSTALSLNKCEHTQVRKKPRIT
jgi:hypothetical protein